MGYNYVVRGCLWRNRIMTKVDKIKEKIIDESLYLFNTQGINRTSIQDIMEATLIPRGNIYRRFKNKDEIVLAAFEKGGEIVWKHFNEAVRNKEKAIDKIIAIFLVYQDAVNNPPIAGGCPLLNMAIETDLGFPELRDRASEGYNKFLLFLQSIIDEGIESKEFKQDLDSYNLASFLVSTMEGAVMTSRLSLNNEHMLHSIEQVRILLQHNSKKNQS